MIDGRGEVFQVVIQLPIVECASIRAPLAALRNLSVAQAECFALTVPG